MESKMGGGTIGMHDGIEGNIQCRYTSLVLTIFGITQLNPLFTFQIRTIRNPPRSTNPINFTVTTYNSAGHTGEQNALTNNYISCNYPCKTCSNTNPYQCTSCNSLGDEVFTHYGVNKYIFYVNENECLQIPHIYTYMPTSTTAKSI